MIDDTLPYETKDVDATNWKERFHYDILPGQFLREHAVRLEDTESISWGTHYMIKEGKAYLKPFWIVA